MKETDSQKHRKFRILSLEGGGIAGAFAASVLATLEKYTGHRCIEHFDLIAGTSTGGLIAIGLGIGLPAEQILSFYENNGPIIFQNAGITKRWSNSIRHIFQSKYSQGVLREALLGALRDPETGKSPKFGESKCRLLIPTYDAVGGRIFLMKTAHHERFRFDINALAVDVALATAAAPTYFSAVPFQEHASGASYIDGGVWANCPALAAVVEAVHFLNIPPDDIDILNIGTTSSPFSVSEHAQAGIFGWARGLINLLMRAQVETSRATAFLLTKGGILNINFIAPNNKFSLDDSRKIGELVALGRSEAVKREILEAVQTRFLNGVKVEPFVPIHAVRS